MPFFRKYNYDTCTNVTSKKNILLAKMKMLKSYTQYGVKMLMLLKLFFTYITEIISISPIKQFATQDSSFKVLRIFYRFSGFTGFYV